MAGFNLREAETNGIRMRLAEAREGPLVLLLHGFPEGWHYPASTCTRGSERDS